MKKKLTIAILITFVALVSIAVAGFSVVQEMKKQEEKANYEYATESTRISSLQEPIVLDSEEDEKGFAFGGYVAGFPWQGTMVLTVLEAGEYSTLEEAGLDAEKKMAKGTDGYKSFVVLKMKLLNRSASSIDRGNRFNIATFVNLLAGNPLSRTGDIVYFDGTASDADPHKGLYEFILDKNEEHIYTVAVEVSPKELEGDVFMAIGLSHCEKYRASIDLNGSL